MSFEGGYVSSVHTLGDYVTPLGRYGGGEGDMNDPCGVCVCVCVCVCVDQDGLVLCN